MTGPPFTPSAGCARCLSWPMSAHCCRRPPRAPWSGSASASPSSADPPEPPARLHGDLWSGNVLAGTDGRPWLIDPSVYGGHREVDLAMLRLFGAPSERVFAAYRGDLAVERGLGRSGSSSGSCCRCSCTPFSSAAPMATPPLGSRFATPADARPPTVPPAACPRSGRGGPVRCARARDCRQAAPVLCWRVRSVVRALSPAADARRRWRGALQLPAAAAARVRAFGGTPPFRRS